ncbi:MAG: LytTR family DNA-binding domain-containing protein [Agathobacter sp.]|nr:LytTR family DNA-binding domain-containing protein [Agathobacter sp.]
MKIRIEIDDNLTEEEIVIRCRTLNEDVLSIQKNISEAINTRMQLNVIKGDAEYYITLEEILFFETDGSMVAVHTKGQIYETKLRLYELEEMLPGMFMRVSKSTILNTTKIRAIHKNITGASEVEFIGSNKLAFVSRNYFKPLMSKIEEKRLKR